MILYLNLGLGVWFSEGGREGGRQPGSVEGPGEVDTEDGHPSKHGHSEEISQVANYLAGQVLRPVGEVEDDEEEGGLEDVDDDVGGDEVTVEVVQLGQDDVDQEGEEEEDDADQAEDRVDHPEGSVQCGAQLGSQAQLGHQPELALVEV